jgi:hypothetical protein
MPSTRVQGPTSSSLARQRTDSREHHHGSRRGDHLYSVNMKCAERTLVRPGKLKANPACGRAPVIHNRCEEVAIEMERELPS